METKVKKKKSFIQFIKFCMVGVCNTVVSYTIYAITVFVMSHVTNMKENDLPVYLTANVLSFLVSVFTAFLLSNKFVFKEEENAEKRVWWKTLLKTYMSYALTGLIINPLLLIVWLEVVKIDRFMVPFVDILAPMGIEMTTSALASYIGPLCNMLVTIPINFIMNKYWAYRQKKPKIV